MSRLRLRISMSLDGFVAGPEQSVKNPLGIGGMRLHERVLPLKPWRAAHGMAGGETNESARVVEESIAGIGATIMGRNMFGGARQGCAAIPQGGPRGRDGDQPRAGAPWKR